MQYTFDKPTLVDLASLAVHVIDAGVTAFGDRLSINEAGIVFHLPDAAEPLTEEEAAALTVAVASYVYAPDPQPIRAERDRRINEVSWRYERHAREVRLGVTPTDDLTALDVYIQALADLPAQPGFPGVVEWPVPPFEEVSV